MATRNIVPRATGEGQIGTSAKTWGVGYFDDIAVTNGVTASTFTGDLTGDVTGNANTATNATNDGLGNNIANTYLPAVVGAVIAFAGSTSPAGWLLCDGSAVSRTDYADLYAVIGDTYGAGNGSTTFNLPNLVDKFVEGSATSGTTKTAGLPNISGSFSIRGTTAAAMVTGTSRSFKTEVLGGSTNINSTIGTGTNLERTVRFLASDANAIYGNSTTVQPPAVTMRYIIKY